MPSVIDISTYRLKNCNKPIPLSLKPRYLHLASCQQAV